MRSIEKRIMIGRSVAAVFAYVSDFKNDVHWRGAVRVMTQSTPTVAVGTETREVLHLMGRDYETLARVTEVVAKRKTTFQGTHQGRQGRIDVLGWRLVEVGDDETCLTLHTEITVSGALVLAAPLLAGVFSRQMRADLVRLKRLLEA